jgi:hypothetical protein
MTQHWGHLLQTARATVQSTCLTLASAAKGCRRLYVLPLALASVHPN